MATRGRKPKERKGYFYEKEEEAIIQYIHEENIIEKNRIFNTNVKKRRILCKNIWNGKF